MTKARKRTGAAKRQAKQRLGKATPADESKVRSPQSATVFLEDDARYGLTTGYSVRVSALEDLAAFRPIMTAIEDHARALAERQLHTVLVAGIEPIAARLYEIVSFSAAAEKLEDGSPDEIAVSGAAKFAGARRRAIGRIAKGTRNLALRHAFGISLLMRANSLEEVRAALVALLSGRADHPSTPAARLITAGDVKKAKAFIAQLDEIKGRAGARKSTDAETARSRDVLHAALELFYDRFGAAVELAFEDDDATRISLLSLIPRRKERRTATVAPPVPNAAQPRTG